MEIICWPIICWLLLAHCLMNEYKFSGKLAAALIDPDHQSRAEH
jgi:hypothetical protein